MTVKVDQSFGNCPKYIQKRDVGFDEHRLKQLRSQAPNRRPLQDDHVAGKMQEVVKAAGAVPLYMLTAMCFFSRVSEASLSAAGVLCVLSMLQCVHVICAATVMQQSSLRLDAQRLFVWLQIRS